MSILKFDQVKDGAKTPNFLQFREYAHRVLEGLRSDGFEKTVEHKIHQQPDTSLEHLAEVILLAKPAHKLDRLKQKMKDHHEIFEAKEALIHYNHAVRNLIWNNPKAIFTNDLVGWLHQSTHDKQWAHGIVAGAAGEVAIARSLKGLGGVKSVRLGTFEEDEKGMDVVVELSSGDLVSVDVKARNHLPSGSQFIKMPPTWISGRRYHHCEMIVESHHINDAAILDERAHRSLLNDMQDYMHGFIDRKRRSVAV